MKPIDMLDWQEHCLHLAAKRGEGDGLVSGARYYRCTHLSAPSGVEGNEPCTLLDWQRCSLGKAMSRSDSNWRPRCNVCGRFIPGVDLDSGAARFICRRDYDRDGVDDMATGLCKRHNLAPTDNGTLEAGGRP